MSVSFIFYLLSCAGCYKMGVFATRHPGELTARGRRLGTRCWRWMNQ